jgi:hypothetical protein
VNGAAGFSSADSPLFRLATSVHVRSAVGLAEIKSSMPMHALVPLQASLALRLFDFLIS